MDLKKLSDNTNRFNSFVDRFTDSENLAYSAMMVAASKAFDRTMSASLIVLALTVVYLYMTGAHNLMVAGGLVGGCLTLLASNVLSYFNYKEAHKEFRFHLYDDVTRHLRAVHQELERVKAEKTAELIAETLSDESLKKLISLVDGSCAGQCGHKHERG
jgi:hypothetical protein